ncbi:hypothetical protein [Maricaulis sp.]
MTTRGKPREGSVPGLSQLGFSLSRTGSVAAQARSRRMLQRINIQSV